MGAPKVSLDVFKLRSIEEHDGFYAYDKIKELLKLDRPVTITCPDHGDFEQLARSHLAGKGCRQCAAKRHTKTTESFICKGSLIHDNFYTYPRTVYTKNSIEVTITCPIHGDFNQLPSNHLMGMGCRECGYEKPRNHSGVVYSSKDASSTTNSGRFFSQMLQMYGDTYEFSKFIYKGSVIAGVVICKFHGEFNKKPCALLDGYGCKHCSHEARLLPTNEYIDKVNIIHNFLYTYGMTKYTGCQQYITVTCNIHGDFDISAASHLNGQGCQRCANKVSWTTDTFISESMLVHNNFYTYPRTEYTGADKYVTITCPIHGDFDQMAKTHLDGSQCMQCCNDGQRKTTEQFIFEARQVHGDTYLYPKVDYSNRTTPITICCRTHGDFNQLPYHHLQGSGCRQCWLETQSSKPEKEFLDYCSIIQENRQYNIGKLFTDGYAPTTNTIYEFLGDYFHGNPILFDQTKTNPSDNKKRTFGELYDHTFKRFDDLLNLGYNIKYIWENDWNQFKKGKVKEPNIIDYENQNVLLNDHPLFKINDQ